MDSSQRLPAASTTEQQFTFLSEQVERLEKALRMMGETTLPVSLYDGVVQVSKASVRLRQHFNGLQEEIANLRAVAQIGQIINSSLDLDNVLQIVMDTIVRITSAERGFLMLRDETGQLVMRTARNWEQESLPESEFAISHTVLERVITTGQPVLTTNAQEDPRFTGQESIIAYSLRSILCVPMYVKTDLVGAIYADNRIRSGLFSQKDLDLLAAFANQAAVALENARLFASVRKTLAEVTELKSLMDNVFASIVSGVITADLDERVVLCNRAAEEILGKPASQLVGQTITSTIQPLALDLAPHLEYVRQTDLPVVGLELAPCLDERGQLELRFSISPLKDAQHLTQGVAVVVDDLTEKKKLLAQRRLFGRMVSPEVINQLDPDRLQLGGQRAEITILFADLRGFTSFSETVEPEDLVAVLNRYLALAADEILREEGTIDKFLGDAVMAWFNAPIPQEDHTLRAVRAALRIRTAMLEAAAPIHPAAPLSFGFGVHTGDAVLGLMGSERRLEYTAIGDSVNIARRLQEHAAPAQILVSQQAYQRISDRVVAELVQPLTAKGKREPLVVYSVSGLR